MLCIGVNALYLIPGGVGGTEIYLRNLLQALASIDPVNRYVVFTNRETAPDLAPQQPNFVCAPQAVRASNRPARILWEQFVLPWAVRKHGVNVLFNPGFTTPLFCGCPMVTVFHDLQHKRHPEYFRWFDLPFWNFFLWASAHRSRGLISVSEATRMDLKKYYGVDSVVIHHGVEPAFFQIAAARQPQDYLLCVSTLHPHKNIERLLRVYRETPGLPRLIVTGLRGFAAEQLESLRPPTVEFTGWVERERLYDLYRGALGFVYPSLFEGFGMPVLEAMAAGVPLACSDIPVLREVAGNGAIYFDPTDESAIRDALLRLASGSVAVDGSRRRAMGFTWEKSARATLDYLSKCSS